MKKVANPPGNLANAAVYVIEPSVLEKLTVIDKNELDISTKIIPKYLGRIFTYLNSSYHRDIGTMESWIEANHDFPKMTVNENYVKSWTNIFATAKEKLPFAAYLKDKI